MNYPVWELELGGGLLIAIISTIHVFVAHFAVGGGLFLVLTERRAYRTGDAAMLAWLRRHSKFFALLTLVFGAVTGVGIWFTIGLVHPAATSALIHTFVWGWAIEWVFFFVEIAAALMYLATWDKVDRRTHMTFGWIYFGAAFLSLLIINGILTFMFTPGAWLQTRSFLDGFFNPTYWPSLIVRSLGAVAFAGLYVLITAWREEPGLRARLARLGAWWSIPATVAGPLAAWIYFAAAGHGAWDAVTGARLPAAVHMFRGVVVAAIAYTLLLATVSVLARRVPKIVSLPVGVLLLVFGYGSIAGAEYVRESIRKPYVIGNPTGGYMYANSLTPAEVESTRKNGLLAASRWVDRDDGARGAEVFRVACRSCHTVDGYRSIRKRVDGRPVEAIAIDIDRLESLRGHMPPFPGNDAEKRFLAAYLDGLDGQVAPEPKAPPSDPLARGKQVYERRCARCHEDFPLGPRVKGWSAEDAYEKIGRLPTLNADMPAFKGTDEERRALADYLAALGAGTAEQR